jgi:hypothetical protein
MGDKDSLASPAPGQTGDSASPTSLAALDVSVPSRLSVVVYNSNAVAGNQAQYHARKDVEAPAAHRDTTFRPGEQGL